MKSAPGGIAPSVSTPMPSLSDLLVATEDVAGQKTQDLWSQVREDEDRKMFEMIDLLKGGTP